MKLTEEDKGILLKTARLAIESYLADGTTIEPDPLCDGSPALGFKAGAFVTLHKKGRLRGCIGQFSSEGPLIGLIAEMAVSAAVRDPRFPDVRVEELIDIDIEISVLTPLERTDDPASIEVGRHGIYIIKGFSRGVLLPQVATENGFDRETFLDQTCMKAGLAPTAWRDPETEIYSFEAIIFGEKG